MSENLQKLIGVVVMAVLVVVGVVVTGGDDTDFTRNYADEPKDAGLFVPDGRNDGKALDLKRDPIFRGKADYNQFRYQPDNDLKLVEAVRLGGQEGEAVRLGGQEGEAFRSERRNVVAFGNSSVASVIIDDNHFRDVDDPAGALRKLAEGKEPLMAEDQALGIRGPISKVVGGDRPTLAIQTDDGLTLGPLGGDGVFVSIQDEALIDVDTSEYTEVEWTLLAKSLLEASENLQRLAEELRVWTDGNATS